MGDALTIIPDALSGFGSYPNPLGVTEEDRASFHSVVDFPKIWADDTSGDRVQIPDLVVRDWTRPSDKPQLATEEERTQRRQRQVKSQLEQHENIYDVGRYDENRVSLYVSEMFEDTNHDIEGYAGKRTIHIGIDLGGPVGTKVYAFTDGVVHSAGYNADLGDYGNVVVIEHVVPSNGRKMWALYGHLDGTSIQGKHPGQRIKKGQVIGQLGDIHENGGWKFPHVHFQLSTEAPETHDMPGAVTLEDRPRALVHYPDPRWVLGMLY